MIIEIDTKSNIPYLKQAEKILYEYTLLKTKSNYTAASKLLGIHHRTLRTKLNTDYPELKLTENVATGKGYNNKLHLILLFEKGYTLLEISKVTNIATSWVRMLLLRHYKEKELAAIVKKNRKIKGKNMENIDQILETNRLLLLEISEKFRENKSNELSEENIFYAGILFKNGFMLENGVLTEEGINALQH